VTSFHNTRLRPMAGGNIQLWLITDLL